MALVQQLGLLVLLLAIGAAVWLVVDARRRRSPAAFVAVGVVDLLCGVLVVGLIGLHLATILWRTVWIGLATGELTYDFRFYSLVLVGVVILVPGMTCARCARGLARGDLGAWRRALEASGLLLLINVPLAPLQTFATGFAVLAGVNAVTLWAARNRFRRSPLEG